MRPPARPPCCCTQKLLLSNGQLAPGVFPDIKTFSGENKTKKKTFFLTERAATLIKSGGRGGQGGVGAGEGIDGSFCCRPSFVGKLANVCLSRRLITLRSSLAFLVDFLLIGQKS